MARHKSAFSNLLQVNESMEALLRTLPLVVDQISEETEEHPGLSTLVLSLQTLLMWVRRRRSLEERDLPSARLRFGSVADIILDELQSEEARALSPSLRKSLAMLGKLFLSLKTR